MNTQTKHSTEQAVINSRKFNLAPAPHAIKDRGDLSFTGWIPRDEFQTLDNWLPARLPEQLNQWGKERDMGAAMVEEIMALRQSDEVEALNAIQFALSASGWRVSGSGVESGFSESIAALAVAGMRALERGEPLYL